MTNNLRMARPPQGVSAVDVAFEKTVQEIFSLTPLPNLSFAAADA